VKQALAASEDVDVLPHRRELTNPWTMAKDGKVWFDPDRFPEVFRKVRFLLGPSNHGSRTRPRCRIRHPLTVKVPAMADSSVKERVIEAVRELPDDATVEDAMERLYVLAKIQKGLEQAEAGQTVSHEEAKRRIFG
jgi:predicted transcriptional regulator